MAIVKGFFHGRGRHSKGWDGYILCGEVNSEDDVFDKKTCKNFTNLYNYYIQFKSSPTPEELDNLILSRIATHKSIIEEDATEIPDPPEIEFLKEEGIIDEAVKVNSIYDLKKEHIKKEKTAPMAKLEAVDAIIDGSEEVTVDDYVENQLTDEEQLDLALKVKDIKDKRNI